MERLYKHSLSDNYPFHMPGHKRRRMGDIPPEQIDITEIWGFDDLHNASGVIKEAQDRAARVFGAGKSFFLVNGSTGGLLAAICAAAGRRGHIIAARNCHRCVYHAIYLMEIRAEYVMPQRTGLGIQGSIDPGDVRRLLEEHDDISAVVITSPTYDGVVSDIASIAEAAHAHGAALIVDEAHGAHFGFSPGFPRKAVSLGADYTIESVHKTLPAYTQSALLLTSERGYVDESTLKRMLRVFQSTSPSYILMAGIDRCAGILEQQGGELFDAFIKRLSGFYEGSGSLEHLFVLPKDTAGEGIYDRDISKLLISAMPCGISGAELERRLRREFHIDMEMSSLIYVTALTSIMDTDEGFDRLLAALKKIDAQIVGAGDKGCLTGPENTYRLPERAVSLSEAMDAESSALPLDKAEGCICADMVCPYPPGIPVLLPGEIIDGSIIEHLDKCLDEGISIQGVESETERSVRVIRDGSHG